MMIAQALAPTIVVPEASAWGPSHMLELSGPS
jgi:hypothetical protein